MDNVPGSQWPSYQGSSKRALKDFTFNFILIRKGNHHIVWPQMTVTFDEQFLLTVSEDGCLLMWKLVDKDGRGLKMTRQLVHAEEILVTKADLEETVRTCSHYCLVMILSALP